MPLFANHSLAKTRPTGDIDSLSLPRGPSSVRAIAQWSLLQTRASVQGSWWKHKQPQALSLLSMVAGHPT